MEDLKDLHSEKADKIAPQRNRACQHGKEKEKERDREGDQWTNAEVTRLVPFQYFSTSPLL